VTHREQYHITPEEELREYVKELKERKQDKTHGHRVTAKSKVMDIYHTFEELKDIVSTHHLSPPLRVLIGTTAYKSGCPGRRQSDGLFGSNIYRVQPGSFVLRNRSGCSCIPPKGVHGGRTRFHD